MMEINELLPIGTVVLLKGGEKKVMIFGVKQSDTSNEDDIKEYDYIGVMYPEGNMGLDFQYLFNHEDVETVYFRGFEDEQRPVFLERLKEYYENNGTSVS